MHVALALPTYLRRRYNNKTKSIRRNVLGCVLCKNFLNLFDDKF